MAGGHRDLEGGAAVHMEHRDVLSVDLFGLVAGHVQVAAGVEIHLLRLLGRAPIHDIIALLAHQVEGRIIGLAAERGHVEIDRIPLVRAEEGLVGEQDLIIERLLVDHHRLLVSRSLFRRTLCFGVGRPLHDHLEERSVARIGGKVVGIAVERSTRELIGRPSDGMVHNLSVNHHHVADQSLLIRIVLSVRLRLGRGRRRLVFPETRHFLIIRTIREHGLAGRIQALVLGQVGETRIREEISGGGAGIGHRRAVQPACVGRIVEIDLQTLGMGIPSVFVFTVVRLHVPLGQVDVQAQFGSHTLQRGVDDLLLLLLHGEGDWSHVSLRIGGSHYETVQRLETVAVVRLFVIALLFPNVSSPDIIVHVERRLRELQGLEI